MDSHWMPVALKVDIRHQIERFSFPIEQFAVICQIVCFVSHLIISRAKEREDGRGERLFGSHPSTPLLERDRSRKETRMRFEKIKKDKV